MYGVDKRVVRVGCWVESGGGAEVRIYTERAELRKPCSNKRLAVWQARGGGSESGPESGREVLCLATSLVGSGGKKSCQKPLAIYESGVVAFRWWECGGNVGWAHCCPKGRGAVSAS